MNDIKVQISAGIIQWTTLNQELVNNFALFDDESWRSDMSTVLFFLQNTTTQLGLVDHPEGENEIEELSSELIKSLYDMTFEYEYFLDTSEEESFSRSFEAANNSLVLLEQIDEQIDLN